jgi:FkbM family methyltransferase
MSSAIIDVGAHDGSAFSLPWSEDITNTVYAIEPNPQLAARLSSHDRPNLHVFCCALGEVDGVLPFYLNCDDQTSSLLPANCVGDWQPYQQQLETVQVIDVPVKRLDTFISEQGLTAVDLLKIDAQGFDLQVLKGAGQALHLIRKITLEVQLQPLYEGSATKDEVLEYLGNQGFVLSRAIPQTDGLEENLEFIRSQSPS